MTTLVRRLMPALAEARRVGECFGPPLVMAAATAALLWALLRHHV